MRSTEEKIERVLLSGSVERAPKSKFDRLKHVDWRGTIVTWVLSIGALLATGELKTVITIVIILSFALPIIKSKVRTHGQSPKITKDAPPRRLLLIAAFVLPPDSREAALGDMEEIYKDAVKRFGHKGANYLMGRDILGSIFSRLIDLTRKMLIMALKVIGIYELYRRFKG